jgi:hypothetical protein
LRLAQREAELLIAHAQALGGDFTDDLGGALE